MNLRYSANIMKFEDGMKKVSAIAWAHTGRKLAVASADKVHLCIYSDCISVRRDGREKGQIPNKTLRQATEILFDSCIVILPRFDKNCSGTER